MISNPTLCGYLQLYACLVFDLASKRRVDDSDRHKLLVNVGVEPADIRHFHDIYQKMPEPGTKITGMAQINDIQTWTEPFTSKEELNWKRVREHYPRDYHLVLFEFERSGGPQFSWLATIGINHEIVKMAGQRASECSTEKPFDKATILTYVFHVSFFTRRLTELISNSIWGAICIRRELNGLIRKDKENEFKLRLNMTRFDMRCIHGVAEKDASINPLAVEMLVMKMIREKTIYLPLLIVPGSSS